MEKKKLETKLICRRAHLSTTVTAAAIAPLKWLLNICIFFIHHLFGIQYPALVLGYFTVVKQRQHFCWSKTILLGYIELTTCSTACSFFALCCNVTIATVCMRLHRETRSTIVTITTLIKSANERFQLLRMMFSDAKLF